MNDHPPLVLLDVDGVLNALSDFGEHEVVWPKWLRGRASADGTSDRAKAEWIIRAPKGTVVAVEARHDRAGVVRASVVLGD